MTIQLSDLLAVKKRLTDKNEALLTRFEALAARVAEVAKQEGPRGQAGTDGKDAVQLPALPPIEPEVPEKGIQGVSVVGADISFDDHLVLTLSDGSEIDAGDLNIPDAERIMLSGGQGAKGEKGDTGAPGGGGGGGHIISQDDVDKTPRANLDFAGADFLVTDDQPSDSTDITLSAARVAQFVEIAANTSARHDAVSVNDTPEIDLTLVGQLITAAIVTSSIDVLKLDSGVQTSLGDADSASQPGHTHVKGDLTDIADFLLEAELASVADVKALNQSVISGATPAFTTTNFTDAAGKRLMTDAQETILDNTSNTNTGDDATNSQYSGLVTNADHTGHIITTGAAAILGSFTVAQLSAAISNATLSGNNTGDQTIPVVSDTPYDAGTWDTNTDAATKNAIRDKFESLGGGTVDTAGSPIALDFARFTGATTIEGLSNSEVKTALGYIESLADDPTPELSNFLDCLEEQLFNIQNIEIIGESVIYNAGNIPLPFIRIDEDHTYNYNNGPFSLGLVIPQGVRFGGQHKLRAQTSPIAAGFLFQAVGTVRNDVGYSPVDVFGNTFGPFIPFMANMQILSDGEDLNTSINTPCPSYSSAPRFAVTNGPATLRVRRSVGFWSTGVAGSSVTVNSHIDFLASGLTGDAAIEQHTNYVAPITGDDDFTIHYFMGAEADIPGDEDWGVYQQTLDELPHKWNGAQHYKRRNRTSAYTFNSTDHIIRHDGAAANYTLPLASTCIDRVHTLFTKYNSSGDASYKLSGSDTLDGSSGTVTVATFMTVQSDGVNLWEQIG